MKICSFSLVTKDQAPALGEYVQWVGLVSEWWAGLVSERWAGLVSERWAGTVSDPSSKGNIKT